MLRLTLRVHLSSLRAVDVRGAVDFSVAGGALYVWDHHVVDEVPSDEVEDQAQAICVFAPGNWTHAEWLGR